MTTKVVDGVRVDLTPEEEVEIRAGQDATPSPPPDVVDVVLANAGLRVVLEEIVGRLPGAPSIDAIRDAAKARRGGA